MLLRAERGTEVGVGLVAVVAHELDGLAVDEDASVAGLDGAEAEALGHGVAPGRDGDGVEVGRLLRPERRVRNLEAERGAPAHYLGRVADGVPAVEGDAEADFAVRDAVLEGDVDAHGAVERKREDGRAANGVLRHVHDVGVAADAAVGIEVVEGFPHGRRGEAVVTDNDGLVRARGGVEGEAHLHEGLVGAADFAPVDEDACGEKEAAAGEEVTAAACEREGSAVDAEAALAGEGEGRVKDAGDGLDGVVGDAFGRKVLKRRGVVVLDEVEVPDAVEVGDFTERIKRVGVHG